MSAVYAQYEGFTVAGKQVGGFAQSDFFNIDDDGTTQKDKKEIVKEATKAKAQNEQIKTTSEKITVKAEKAKKKEEISREEIVAKVLAKQRKKGEIAYRQWLGEVGDDYFDYAPLEEIRKRYGV
jgi:transcriptional regulator NrdR family protein